MYMTYEEKNFQEIKAKMQEKYKDNLVSFSKNQGVDMDIAWAMLFCNAKAYANGATEAVVKGGGEIDVPELVKDFNELAKFILWQ